MILRHEWTHRTRRNVGSIARSNVGSIASMYPRCGARGRYSRGLGLKLTPVPASLRLSAEVATLMEATSAAEEADVKAAEAVPSRVRVELGEDSLYT